MPRYRQPERQVVIVEGGIGVGKTEFAQELGAALGTQSGKPACVLVEPATAEEAGDANPYLSDYYSDPARWALVMQVHLLQARLRMHLQAQWYAMSGCGDAVVDRSFYGDVAFLELQVRDGHVSDREQATYQALYATMTSFVRLPSVCVRLITNPTTAVARINERASRIAGRKCETGIDLGYLVRLDEEIDRVTRRLADGGVTVLLTHWDQDRPSSSDRADAVAALAARILSRKQPDIIDMHQRGM